MPKKDDYLSQVKAILDTAAKDPEMSADDYSTLCDEVGDEGNTRYDDIVDEEEDGDIEEDEDA